MKRIALCSAGALFLMACGDADQDTSEGTRGVETPLATIAEESPGENCPGGGTVFQVGNDENDNGVLDEDEVEATEYQCAGAIEDGPVEISSPSATETDRELEFTIRLAQPSAGDLTLSLRLVSITTDLETDITPPDNLEVSFAPGEQDKTFSVQVNEDELAECDERFLVQVLGSEGLSATGVGTILGEGNVGIEASFVSSVQRVPEADAEQERWRPVIELSRPACEELEVPLQFTAGTATEGDDYSPVASITIPRGAYQAELPSFVVDDADLEPLETLSITLGQNDLLKAGARSTMEVQIEPKILLVKAADYTQCVLFEDNGVKCFGDPDNVPALLLPADLSNANLSSAETGWGDEFYEVGEFAPYAAFGDGTVTDIHPGYGATCLSFESGAVRCFGDSSSGTAIPGDGIYGAFFGDEASEQLGTTPSIDVGAGFQQMGTDAISGHFCAIFEGGRVKCWGDNEAGECGPVNPGTSLGDVAAELGENLPFLDLGTDEAGAPLEAIQVSAGYDFTCAVFSQGGVKCWGKNGPQLGIASQADVGDMSGDPVGDDVGDMGDALPFLQLPDKAKRVRAGYDFACALLESDQLVCWGENSDGQLGQGFDYNIGDDPVEMSLLLPIDLGTGRTVVDFDLGFYQACALLDNGDLKCWGSGEYGQNGSGTEHNIGTRLGDMGDRLAPIDFGDRKVLQIAIPGYSTCALLDSNELVCWGYDDDGESATPARNGDSFGNTSLTVPGKLEASVLF